MSLFSSRTLRIVNSILINPDQSETKSSVVKYGIETTTTQNQKLDEDFSAFQIISDTGVHQSVSTNLVINEHEPNFDTIMQEISKNKIDSEEENKLEKRQDTLIKNIMSTIRSTTLLQGIESIEVIAASMTPTAAAVRERNHLTHDKSFSSKIKTHTGNIISQRRLFSTKKKNGNNRSTTQLEKPAHSFETNDIALNLLL